MKRGEVNQKILDHLEMNDNWLTCEQIATALNANPLSVRCSMYRFVKTNKVRLKKEKVKHSTGSNRLYFYKHKKIIDLADPMDAFLYSGGVNS